MNKTYRLVWNVIASTWVAVAECARARGKRTSTALLVAGIALAGLASAQAQGPATAGGPAAPAPHALPSGGQVVGGQAAIGQSGSTMTITQQSQRAAIDWRSFDVGAQAQVDFVQPSADAVALNRVQGGDASRIFGRINANGQVFLSNPNGVYFAPGASVDVGGLVATTHGISLDDFMAGRVRFERQGATGSVVNEGELRAALGGYIALLAPEVRNQGVVLAQMGTVAMAAGEAFELRFDGGHSLAGLRVEPSTIRALVDNRSAVLAPGGLILLSAQAADRVQGGVIRNSGRLEATGLAQRGGRIVLEASDAIDNSGSIVASATADGPAGEIRLEAPEVLNSGRIEAQGLAPAAESSSTAAAAASRGGAIEIDAGHLRQTARGSLDVSATQRGGSLTLQASGRVDIAGRVTAAATAPVAAPAAAPAAAADAADGGSIEIQAAQIRLDDARLDASGDRHGGTIRLDASAAAPAAPAAPLPAPVPEPGQVILNGNTQISSRGRRGQGGAVTVLGDDIGLQGGTTIDGRGASGGGDVLVGGGWQGGGGLHQARRVAMAAGARIDASATVQGDGGSVVLWSDVARADGHTQVDGRILARGGAAGGNGGRVETSGHTVAIEGARVNAGADAGQGGQWLIDPYNYSIGAAQAAAIVGNASSGLNSGTSVTVTTTASNTSYGGSTNSADVGNIEVTSAIHKTSGGDATLTLQAHGSITLNGAVQSSANKLNLVLIADWDSGNAGAIFLKSSSISTNGGHVWIGGNGYAVAGSSAIWNGLTVGTGVANSNDDTTIHEGVRLNVATIATGGGDVYIGGRNSRTLNETRHGVVLDTGSSISTGAGSITVQGSIQTQTGGSSDNQEVIGLRLDNASLSSTSGQITLTGSTEGGMRYGVGLSLRNGSSVTSTSGAITLRGTASGVLNTPTGGVFGTQLFNRVTVSSDSGAINLYGTSTASSSTGAGFWMGSAESGGDGNQSAGAGNGYNVAIVSNSGDVLVDARGTSSATNSWFHALAVITYAGDKQLIKTGSGNITLKGDANVAKDDSSGVQFQVNTGTGNIHVVSTSGDIYVQGYQHSGNTAEANNALRFTPGNSVGSIRFGAADDGASYTGRITFEADSIWNNTGNTSLAGAIKAIGSGAIGFQSSAARSVKDFTLVNLWDFGSAHSSFAIGKPTETKAITLGAAVTAAGPITVQGGNIVLRNDLTSTAAGAGIRLLASGSIRSDNSVGSTLTLDANAGHVVLASDTDGNGGGNIDFSLQALSIDTRVGPKGAKTGTSGGGHITLGGGNTSGTGYANGWGTNDAEGIRARGLTLRSGGGDINLRGRSWDGTLAAGGHGAWGVGVWDGNLSVDSGTGRVRVEGIGRSSSPDSYHQGIATNGQVDVRSAHAGGDAITLIGSTTKTNTGWDAGIDLGGNSGNPTADRQKIIASGAGGGITLQGQGGSVDQAILLRSGTQILAASGPIQLIGLGSNSRIRFSSPNISFGSAAGAAITTSSSTLLLQADTLSWDTANRPNIATSGAVTVQSNASSYPGGQTLQTRRFNWNDNGHTIGGLTLGRPTNTGGNVTFDGTHNSSSPLLVNGPVTAYGRAVTVTAPLQVTNGGDIYLRAYQDGDGAISIDSSIGKTGGGDATLTLRANGRVQVNNNISASGGGTGKLNVVLWADSDGNRIGGVGFGAQALNSHGGHVWIGGSASANSSTSWNGLTVGDGASPGAYGSNHNGIDLRGSFNTGGGDLYAAGKTYVVNAGNWDINATAGNAAIDAGSGNISFVGNRIDFGGVYTPGTSTSVTTTGTLTIRPWDDSFTYAGGFNVVGALSGSDWIGTTTLDANTYGTANLIIRNAATLGGLVIGKASNTSAITVRNSLGIAGDISLYGGRIANAGNATLTSTAGNILLDADRGRVLDFNGRGISWVGGGLNASSGAAGRGNLTLRGRGGSKVGDNQGVLLGTAALNAGGDLRVDGIAPAQQNTAVYVDGGTTLNAGRSLTIDGRNQATVSSANNRGVLLFNNVALSSVGALSITGGSGPGTAAAVELGNGASLSTSGSAGHVRISALNGGSITSGSGGSNAASSIAAHGGGDITLTADSLALHASKPLTLTTTGTLSIEPWNASFSSPFVWDGTLSGGDLLGAASLASVQVRNLASLGGLTLGKAGNTSNLVVDALMLAAGAVRLHGHDITLNDGVIASGNATADRNRVVITASGNVAQTAAIQAHGLSLQGSGRYTLNHPGNDVDVLAAGSAGAPVGRLAYLDADDLAIGSVDGSSGVSASGTVRVETLTGNLHLGASVASASSSTDAVVLNAARAKGVADGDFLSGAGGSISVAGGATVTTGAGGRATLYTGSLGASTGLSALVGSGSGRFRYASDETTTNYLSPLGTGLYAIYREQPTVTLRGIDQSVVYGTAPTLAVGAGGMQNGDTVAQSLGRLPTATLAGATRSAAGHLNVRRDGGGHVIGYGMTLSRDAVSALGYSLAYDDGGSTTVTPRALAAVINDDAKFVSLADMAGYAGATFSGFARGESVADVAASATLVRSVAGETVGSYAGALTGSVNVTAGNYVLDPSNVTAGNFHIVGPETLIVRVGSASAVYGNAASYDVSQVRYYDSVNGVERSLTQGADEFHWSFGGNPALGVSFTLASAGIDVGNHAITGSVITPHGLPGTASPSTPGNLLAIGGRLTITPRTVTLAASKTYDGNTALGAGDLTLGNLVGGQTLGYTGALASDRNVATAGKHVTAITLADGTGLASNYALPDLTQAAAGINAVVITPRSLGVVVDKVYDGLTSATAGQTTLTNLAAGETLAIGSVTLSDRHVATAGKYVSALSLADSGPWRLSNYSLPGLTAADGHNSVSITAAPLTVSIASATGTSKVYDGTDATSGFNAVFGVSGYVAGDSAASFGYTARYDADTVDATRIGLDGVSLSGISSGVGSLASDYALDVGGAFTAGSITPRSVTANAAASPVKVYDGSTSVAGARVALAAATGSTGLVAGDDLSITAVGGSYSQGDVGTGLGYTLADITLSGADARNYVLTSGSISGSDGVITPRALTLTAGKTYDGTTVLADVALGNLVQGEYLLLSGLGLASAHVAGPDGDASTDDNFVRNITLSNVMDDTTVVYRTSNYCLPGAGCAAVTSGAAQLLGAHADNQATVEAARLSVSVAETQVSKVYDGTTAGSGGYTYVVDGLVANDSAVTLTQAGAAFNDANVAAASSFTLSGIAVSGVTGSNGSQAGDYVLDRNGLVLPGSITARSVAVDVSAGIRKVYDTTADFQSLKISLTDVAGDANSGVLAADAQQLDVAASGGGFDSRHAGTGKSYTLTGLHLTGAAAGNYQLASGDGMSGLNGVIDPKTLQVTGLDAVTKVYDGNTTASYGGAVGTLASTTTGSGSPDDGRFFAGDDVTLAGSATGASFNSRNVADASRVDLAGYTLGGADAANYVVVASASGSITQKALTASASLVARSYDGSADVAVGSVTLGGLVGSEQLNAGGTGTLDGSNAGLHTASLSYTLADGANGGLASNYSVGDGTQAFTVTRKALSVSGTTVDTRAYDGTTAADISAGSLVGLVGSETLGVAAGGSFDSANAGSRSATVGYTLTDGSHGGLASNYSVATEVVAGQIDRKAVTLSAGKVYDGGTALGAGTVTIGGLVGSETLGYGGAVASDAHVATAGKHVTAITLTDGSYGGLAGNYELPTLDAAHAAVTITAKALTGSASIGGTLSKVYDGSMSANGASVGGSVSGAVAGDTVTLDTSGITLGYDSAHVAEASQIGASGSLGFNLSGSNGSQASDYSFSAPGIAPVSAGITPATLTATLVDAGVSKVYDGTTAAPTGFVPQWQVGGLVAGDTGATLGHGSAAYDHKDVATVSTLTVGGVNLQGVSGSLGSRASDYVLASTQADVAARIDRRAVTLSAGKVYDGGTALGAGTVTIGGLVGSETLGYSGAVASDAHVATAGKHVTAITLTDGSHGGLAGNYELPTLDAAHAAVAIMAKALTGSASIGGTLSKVYDGSTSANGASVGGSVSGAVAGDTVTLDTSGITLGYDSAHVAEASQIGASGSLGFNLSGSNGSQASDYSFSAPGIAPVSAGITPATLTATLVDTGVSKVYDGTTAAPAGFVPQWQVGGLVAGDTGATLGHGSAAYDHKDVATASTLTVGGVNLQGVSGSLGSRASDYALASTQADVAARITPRSLQVAYQGVDRVYDGSTGASVTTQDDRIAGDRLLIQRSAAFADKNVGTGKLVTISGVTLSGDDAGNYTVVSGGETRADITRLASVEWIGGPEGNWFDPANWAGGAVPDLANVENVLIPNGVLVHFDSSGAVAPAQAGPVQIESLGQGGSLEQHDGTLEIGTGGMTLDRYEQHGGSLSSEGDIHLNEFSQHGGSTTTAGDLTVDGNFSQEGPGQVRVDGNATLIDREGGVTLGNLEIGGDLRLDSEDGPVTQQPGSTITVQGGTSVDAGDADVTLDGANNDFQGPVNVVGGDVTLVDGHGGIELGEIDAKGDVGVISTDGAVTQTPGSTITVQGETSVDAGDADVTLDGANNDFQGPVNVTGGDVTLVDGHGGIELGEIDAKGDLGVTSTDGAVTQQPGSTITVQGEASVDAGDADVTLDGANNDFQGPVNVAGGDVTLADGHGGIELGRVDARGDLGVTSTGGAVTQQPGASLTVRGETRVDAGGADVRLDGSSNDFRGAVHVRGHDVTLVDGRGGLVLGDIEAGGDLDALSTDGNISQAPGTRLDVQGDARLAAPGADVRLSSPNNAIHGRLDVPGLPAVLEKGRLPELPPVTPPGVLPTPDQAPAPLGDAVTRSSAALAPELVGSAVDGELTVRVLDLATADQPGLIEVTVSPERAAEGFSFELPSQLTADLPASAAISAELEDGSPLPAWLRFDAAARRFTASAVPAGALPVRVRVQIDGRPSVIVISTQDAPPAR